MDPSPVQGYRSLELVAKFGEIDGCREPHWMYGRGGRPRFGKMFQCPVPYTVRTRNLADLETHDSFVNLVRIV